VIWGGASAQAVIVETINTAGSGATVTRDLGLPFEVLTLQRADPRMSVESLGGAIVAVGDSLLSIEFPLVVLRDWGAGARPTIYRRFSRSGISGRVRRLFFGRRTQGTLAFEGGVAIREDQNGLTEVLATERTDPTVPAESLVAGGASVTGDSILRMEGLTVQRADWGARVESLVSGASAVIGDSILRIEGLIGQRADWGAWVESLVAAGTAVLDDSMSPIESLKVQRGDVGAAIENKAILRIDPGGSAEALVALARDTVTPLESLVGGVITIADAVLAFEWGGAGPAVLLSLESGPDRIRLLATPGRVRLLRRN